MPLMLNYVQSKEMEVVREEDISLMYDPISQITLFMGGGSSKGTKSMKETKRTQDGWSGPGQPIYKEDHTYGSDD